MRVYPRVCGETLPVADLLRFVKSGLSPRVRGNLRGARVVGALSPRRTFTAMSATWAGLSPRVRGNRR